MRAVTLPALCLIGLAVSPEPSAAAPTDTPAPYTQSCNENGYVLTADPGAEGLLASQPTYLGKSCDAYNAAFGNGHWCSANSGITAEFAGQIYGFRAMELYCENPALTGSECFCHENPLPSRR